MSIAPRCHEHGDYMRGCFYCRRYSASVNARRDRMSRQGTWERLVDAGPVIAHIAHLRESGGLLLREISDRSNVPLQTVKHLARGSSATGPRRMLPEAARAILAVQPAEGTGIPAGHVSAVGPRRMVRALVAIGHTVAAQSRHSGVAIRELYDTVADYRPVAKGVPSRGRHYIGAELAERIRRLYDDLCLVDGGSVRAKMQARRRRWAPPLAWDEHAIDDPVGRPDFGRDVVGEADWAAVVRVLSGDVPTLREVDRRAAVAALARQRVPSADIAERLDTTVSAVNKTRERLNAAGRAGVAA